MPRAPCCSISRRSPGTRTMLKLFRVPRAVLAGRARQRRRFRRDGCRNCSAPPFRSCGVAGDQQAAAFGQACFAPGDVKSTYGTGCFALVNTGCRRSGLAKPAARNLPPIAPGGKTAYAIEGSIFVAGAVVQWLRDALGVIRSADEIEALARTAKSAEGLIFRPGIHGPRRALLGSRRARRDPGPHARHGRRGNRARGARCRLLPDARSSRCDGARHARRRSWARPAR